MRTFCVKSIFADFNFKTTLFTKIFDKLSPVEDPKFGNFIWLQLIIGQKPCFLGPIQLVRQKVNIHHCIYLSLHIRVCSFADNFLRFPTWWCQRYHRERWCDSQLPCGSTCQTHRFWHLFLFSKLGRNCFSQCTRFER